jgi:predicted RND superfamily exporter protein
MLERLLNLLDRHRWMTLGVMLAAMLAAVWHLPGLQVLDSPERWMPRTTREAWQVVERHFDIGDNIGIGLHFHRPVSEDDLPRLKALRQRLEAVRGISRVYDCSLVAEQIERVSLSTLLAPENSQRFAVYGGALWDSPPADDPSRMLMTVCELEYFANETVTDPDALNARRRHVAAEVERIVAEERSLPQWKDVEFHAASGVLMMGEMEKRTRQVAFRFLPLSLLIGLVTLLQGFRSWRALLITLCGSGMATLLVLGWLSASGGTLGVVTMASPTLISVIATASTIHFAAYAAENGTTGLPGARPHLVRTVCVPCLGSAITTGLGFLLLWFNELAPVRDLGLEMFAGSLLAIVCVMLASQFLPIHDSRSGTWLAPRPMHRFCLATIRFPVAVVVSLSLLSAAMVYCAWPRAEGGSLGLRVDTDPFSFFADDEPIKQALRRFADRKFAVFQLDVVMVPKTVGRPATDLDPPDQQHEANLSAAQCFADEIAERKGVGVERVLSTLAFRERYDAFLADMEQTFARYGPLAAAYQFAGHATSANILSHSFRAWNVDKQDRGALRFTIVANDDGSGFRTLWDEVHALLPNEHFDCFLTGSVAQSVNLAAGLRGGVISGTLLSLAAMTLVCMALFKSWRLALIAIPPNVFPILVVFGVMGVLDIPIGSGSAMVMTVALGIALNDTIHFVLHYRHLTRESGKPIPEAVTETVADLGRPLVMTSLVHVAGFAIFLCTDFLPLYQFGLLASIAMVAALVGDLVMLPNLLVVFDRSSKVAETTAATGTVGQHHWNTLPAHSASEEREGSM